ncbi:hypothetical protein PIB30_107480, partial [Stylosanthes scabra]|nr:hypothetical protein [Stylosanthes scabra]
MKDKNLRKITKQWQSSVRGGGWPQNISDNSNNHVGSSSGNHGGGRNRAGQAASGSGLADAGFLAGAAPAVSSEDGGGQSFRDAEGPCERTASRSTAVTASRIQYHHRLCFLCLLQRASRTIRRRRRSLLCERRWRRSKVEDRGDGIGTHGGDSITVQHHRRGSSLGHFPPSTPGVQRRRKSSDGALPLQARNFLSLN